MLSPNVLRFIASFRCSDDDYADAGVLAARLRALGVQAYPRARGVVGIFEPNGKSYVSRSGETRDSTTERCYSIEEMITRASRTIESIEVSHAAAIAEDAARTPVVPAKPKRTRKAKASS